MFLFGRPFDIAQGNNKKEPKKPTGLPALYEFIVKDTRLRELALFFHNFGKEKGSNTPSHLLVTLTFTHQELPEPERPPWSSQRLLVIVIQHL